MRDHIPCDWKIKFLLASMLGYQISGWILNLMDLLHLTIRVFSGLLWTLCPQFALSLWRKICHLLALNNGATWSFTSSVLHAWYYFHDLIKQMKGWGYQEGSILFGFGYEATGVQFHNFERNFKLNFCLCGNLLLISVPQAPRAYAKVEEKAGDHIWSIRRQESGQVSHSMGGLLVKSFLALHHEVKISLTLKSRR